MNESISHYAFRGILGLVLLLAIAGGLWWFLEGRFIEKTDNAYVEADIAVIASKVPGYVGSVDVTDNQPVKKGQVLLQIETADYEATVAQAKAEVERQRRTRNVVSSGVVAERSVVAETHAALAAAEAEAHRAQADAKRAEQLLKDGWTTRATVDLREADAAAAKAQVAQRKAAILAAEATATGAGGQVKAADAALEAAEAALETARLNLDYATIRSPLDGIVGNRTVRAGQYARQGQQLMVIVPEQSYLLANFKETQIRGMRVGMPVTVNLDAYPDTPLRGRVDSFSPASGSRFSIIPPENATGNFTRIIQRLPVKIVFEYPLPDGITLYPGISAHVHVDLRDADKGVGNK